MVHSTSVLALFSLIFPIESSNAQNISCAESVQEMRSNSLSPNTRDIQERVAHPIVRCQGMSAPAALGSPQGTLFSPPTLRHFSNCHASGPATLRNMLFQSAFENVTRSENEDADFTHQQTCLGPLFNAESCGAESHFLEMNETSFATNVGLYSLSQFSDASISSVLTAVPPNTPDVLYATFQIPSVFSARETGSSWRTAEARAVFTTSGSGSPAPQCSLGAILVDELNLSPEMCSSLPTPGNPPRICTFTNGALSPEDVRSGCLIPSDGATSHDGEHFGYCARYIRPNTPPDQIQSSQCLIQFGFDITPPRQQSRRQRVDNSARGSHVASYFELTTAEANHIRPTRTAGREYAIDVSRMRRRVPLISGGNTPNQPNQVTRGSTDMRTYLLNKFTQAQSLCQNLQAFFPQPVRPVASEESNNNHAAGAGQGGTQQGSAASAGDAPAAPTPNGPVSKPSRR